jgi:hypothetical protein
MGALQGCWMWEMGVESAQWTSARTSPAHVYVTMSMSMCVWGHTHTHTHLVLGQRWTERVVAAVELSFAFPQNLRMQTRFRTTARFRHTIPNEESRARERGQTRQTRQTPERAPVCCT